MPRAQEKLPSVTRRRRVTSRDVARAAGVSQATVSYVLNDHPHQSIPEATRKAVLEAAQRLDYLPSAAARALRLGRGQLVLVPLNDWPIGYNLGQIIERLSLELAREGLPLVTMYLDPSFQPLAEVLKVITPIAVIGLADFGEEDLAALRAAGIEVALTLLSESPQGLGLLNFSQTGMGRLQVQHLAAAGHRRLGFAMPTDPRVKLFADPRLAGFKQACRDRGLEEPIVRTVAEDVKLAAQAIRVWRGNQPPVTAVGAYNDELALALLAGLRSLELEAPRDLALVGIDDIPQAKFAAPPLTTVRVSNAVIARYLGMAIVRQLKGEPPPRSPRSVTKLVVRDSA